MKELFFKHNDQKKLNVSQHFLMNVNLKKKASDMEIGCCDVHIRQCFDASDVEAEERKGRVAKTSAKAADWQNGDRWSI